MTPSPTIELNPQFVQALELMHHTAQPANESWRTQHVFITGRAGTGKSTLLKYFREHAKKNLAVLAPTGVAAVHIAGQTIHSFFRFKPDITVESVQQKFKTVRNAELYKKLDALVIDEISMVRADLLDCIDAFLRMHGRRKKQPFGGVQMILIGDLYQLPPVVGRDERAIFTEHYASPYFFSAPAFTNAQFRMIELEKIYRQQDQGFIDILNGIRNNSVTDAQLATLNRRLDPRAANTPGSGTITLTTTNQAARTINQRAMDRLRGKAHTFSGSVRGEFDTKALPTDIELQLKPGAQVMLVNNDSAGRWVNGTVGVVREIEPAADDADDDIVWVELADGEVVDVKPNTWEMFRFRYEPARRAIVSDSTGSFTQYPLGPAWAITIHKSQGKTFEQVVIDLGRGAFAHGQTYVALSRCTTLYGLTLTQPIQKKHVLLDWRVVRFLTGFQYGQADAHMPVATKVQRIEAAIAGGHTIRMTYLKSNDEKSRRDIQPSFVGTLQYQGKDFLGVEAWCLQRQDKRVFRVDRILEMEVVGRAKDFNGPAE